MPLHRVRLTEKGVNLWHHDLLPCIFAYYEEALENFSLNDRGATLNNLSKLLDNFQSLDTPADD